MAKKSVTRLLAERKALEARIRTATTVPFIGMKKGDAKDQPVGYIGKTVAEVQTLLKSNLDKVRGLIAYHSRITTALVKSNAETEVTIAGETMTVAAAIERKTSIAFEKILLGTALNQCQLNQAKMENENVTVDNKIEKQLVDFFGGEKGKTITNDQRTETAKAINDAHRVSPIDPNNLATFCSEQLVKLNAFETEVDFILSEINAKTEIEIDDENGPVPAPAAAKAPTVVEVAGGTTGAIYGEDILAQAGVFPV